MSIARPHVSPRGQKPSFLAEGTAWAKAQRLECVCCGGSEVQKAETERRSRKHQGRMSRKAGARAGDSVPNREVEAGGC